VVDAREEADAIPFDLERPTRFVVRDRGDELRQHGYKWPVDAER
jgi:hypothetical protein